MPGPELGFLESGKPQTTIEFFHHVVNKLMHDNIEFVLSGSLSAERNVEVLHLIDPEIQEGTQLDYHVVYESHDTTRQVVTHGVYLANPWIRKIKGRPPSEIPSESRHYYDSQQAIIFREDIRSRDEGEKKSFELIDGKSTYPQEEIYPDAMVLYDFRSNLYRVMASTPIMPYSLKFNQFARSS